MSKEFVREDGKKIEFSKLRLNGYRTLIDIWKNRDVRSLATLTKIMKMFNDERSGLDSDDLDIMNELCKVGLFQKKTCAIDFFSINYTYSVLDKEFLDFVFYNKINSTVLHLHDLSLVEKKLINNVEIEEKTNISKVNRIRCLIL